MSRYKRLGFSTYITPEGDHKEYLSLHEEYSGDLLLSSICYNKDEEMTEKTKYEYHNNELVLEKLYNSDDKLIQKIEYSYAVEGGEGKVYETTAYQDGTKDQIITTFENAREIKKEAYVASKLCELEVCSYEGDNIKEYIKYDEDNKEVEREVYTYSDNITKIEKYRDGELEKNITLVSDGENVVEKTFSEKELTTKEHYKYDANNNVTEISIYEEGTLIRKIESRFDDNNNLLKVNHEYVCGPASTQRLEKEFTIYEYDNENRIVSESSNCSFVRYEYL